jgi:lipopolysaccharide export system permease protein
VKKLHRLIIGSFIGPFVLTFFITLFILVMQFLWKYVDDLVGKGLEWYLIAELLLYASANLVPMALPLSILLSSIMTFGTLGENYELVAIKSAGISLQRAMKPLLVVTLFLSFTAFYFSNNIWPIANLKFASLLHDISKKKPALDIKEGIFYKDIDDFVIRVGKKDQKNDILYDISIYDHTAKEGNRKVIRAEEGTMKMSTDDTKLILTLKNGFSYNEVKKSTSPLFRSEFEKEVIYLDVSGFQMNRSDEGLFKNNYKMLNIVQLDEAIDTIKFETELGIIRMGKKVKEGISLFKDTLNNNLNLTTADSSFINLLSYNKGVQNQIYQGAINALRRHKTYITTLSRYVESNDKLIDRHQIEWHRKFTLSIACIILFFIGAPLGAIIRKGGLGMPVIISVLFFLVFHVLSITGEKLVKESGVNPATGMWMATVILVPIGAFLTYKSTTDSAIFDADGYKKIFRNLKGIFKFSKK